MTGTTTGAVTEGNVGDAAVTASGTLTISDVDGDDTPSFADVSSTAGGNNYGSFVLTNGTWTYTLDQSAVQDLDAGETVTDTITFTASDNTTQVATVTITGTNDAPILSGDLSGTVLEGGAFVLTSSDLYFTDADDAASEVTFTVSNLNNGTIEVNGSSASTFTGSQLSAGAVSFVHNDSDTTSASFQVSVEDGDEDGSSPLAQTFNLSVTPVDDTPPVVSSVVMDDTALKVGETSTLTITFSEAVTGFDNTDITLENGLLTAVSSSDGGVTWTGTFTPTDDITDTTNVITVGTSLTDLAGNAPLAGGATSNYTIDTTEPVLTINSSQSTLSSGQTATITFSFNEVVSGFTDSDITVGTGGTLSSITTNDNQTFTAILTPDEGTDTVFDLSDATLLAPGNYSESKTIGDSNALTITLDAYSGSSASTLNVSNNGIGVGNSFVSDNESIVLDFSSDVTGFTFSANSLSSSETLSWTATLSDGTETSGTFAGTGNGNSDQSFTLEAGDLGKEMSSLTISNSGGGSFRISATQFEASQGEGVSGNITISVADNAFEDSAGNQGTGDSISIPERQLLSPST